MLRYNITFNLHKFEGFKLIFLESKEFKGENCVPICLFDRYDALFHFDHENIFACENLKFFGGSFYVKSRFFK